VNIGDAFNIVGYDILATAQCDFGHLLVLSNNSSHFLVAKTETVNGSELDAQGHYRAVLGPSARLVAAFPYGARGGEAASAYAGALSEMVLMATESSPSLEEDDEEENLGGER
jgi:hypothetical protein